MCRGSDQSMPDCDHEEADSRICVHVSDALHKGAHDVLIRTVDTDVVVIPVGSFFHLKTTYPDMNLWVGFGTGKLSILRYQQHVPATWGTKFHCLTFLSCFYGM